MNYLRNSPLSLLATLTVVLAMGAADASAQATKAKASAKPVATVKTAAKSGAKAPGAATKLDQHLAANLNFFKVLSRYAEALSCAKDAASAHQVVTKLELITKEAITSGEELVKLGKPSVEIEVKLAADADLKMTSQTVAEQTRAAVKALSANAEVKAILAPAVENFQAALNRVQQAADEPQGLTAQKPAPAGPPPNGAESKPSADATEVAPPPPQ